MKKFYIYNKNTNVLVDIVSADTIEDVSEDWDYSEDYYDITDRPKK